MLPNIPLQEMSLRITILALTFVAYYTVHAQGAQLLMYGDNLTSQIVSVVPLTAAATVSIRASGPRFLGPISSWTTGLIGPSDVNTTWTLNESTAPGFGVDWQGILDNMSTLPSVPLDRYFTTHFLHAGIAWNGVNGTFASDSCCNGGALVLDRIEFTLLAYSETPDVGGTRYRGTFRFAVYGGAPEPAAWILGVIGVACCCGPNWRRYRW